ncbi:MAG TPA: preprotein translocase subunit YajC [Gaiellaceae bacterium]|jgi:preprotein translocase subunit YajC|nr:preprotein translocase subunit YajC [Gaiellaceae bacterium]
MNAGPLIFLAAILVVFWFLLIRPQRQRQAAHRNLLAQLAAGDEVVTAGGILGTVRSIADDHVLLEVAPGTEVRVAKEAVTGVRPKHDETAAEPADPPLP